jgi:hypothetical protein
MSPSRVLGSAENLAEGLAFSEVVQRHEERTGCLASLPGPRLRLVTSSPRMFGQQERGHAPGLCDPAGSNSLGGVVQLPPLHRHSDLGLVSMCTARPKARGQEQMGPCTRGRGEGIDDAEQTRLARDQAGLFFQFPDSRRLRVLAPDTAPGKVQDATLLEIEVVLFTERRTIRIDTHL